MDLHKTDPEFAERFEHFAFEEVVNEENQQLEPCTRYLVILAALIGCGGIEAYKEILKIRGTVLYQLMFRDIYEMFRF